MTSLTYHSVKDDPETVLVLYRWLRDRLDEEAVNISHTLMPSLSEHSRFISSMPYRGWWILKAEGEQVGVLNLSTSNEVGIYIAEEHRRKGYAREALLWLEDHFDPLPGQPAVRSEAYLANINPNNHASVALFHGLGYHLIQHTYGKSK